MDVLSKQPSPPGPIPLEASIPTGPQQPSRESLLQRRSSRKVPILSTEDLALLSSLSSSTSLSTSSSLSSALLSSTSTSAMLSNPAHGYTHADPSVAVSSTVATGTLLRTIPVPPGSNLSVPTNNTAPVQGTSGSLGLLGGPRRSKPSMGSFLPFIPLTPILASPRLTPDLGKVSSSASANMKEVSVESGYSNTNPDSPDYLEAMARGRTGRGRNMFAGHEEGELKRVDEYGARVDAGSAGEGDYLNMGQLGRGSAITRGDVVAEDTREHTLSFTHSYFSSAAASSSKSMPPPPAPSIHEEPPLWMSTPPTPPQKPVTHPFGLQTSAEVPKKKWSTGRLNQPRPASVAFVPNSKILSSIFRLPSSSHASSSSGPRPRVAAYPAPFENVNDEHMQRKPKRRQSLPPNFLKPLPPLPPASPCASLSRTAQHTAAASVVCLPPSLSRSASYSGGSSPSSSSSRLSPHSHYSHTHLSRHLRTHPHPRPHSYAYTQQLGHSNIHPPSSLKHKPSLNPRSPDEPVLLPSLSRNPHPHTGLRAGSPSPLRSSSIIDDDDHYQDDSGYRYGKELVTLPSSDSGGSFQTAFSSLSPSPTTSPDMAGSGSGSASGLGKVGAGGSKRLFHLHAEDVSEGEGEGDEDNDQEQRDQRERVEKESRARNGIDLLRVEKDETSRSLKRYHALMELLATEVGYLLDLRALVSIYLAQLPSISVALPSPSPSRPSPSSLSISSLGLTRSFPSSRGSFIYHTSLGPPSLETETSQSTSTGEKENQRERGRDERRAILSEKELEVIQRNAEELVKFHETFVTELRVKVEPLGFGEAFLQLGGPTGGAGDSEKAMKKVHEAASVVAEAFARQALSFGIYEAFCPGHSEASDLIRNVQDNYPVEWDAYEQRCSLLVSAQALECVSSQPSKTKVSDSPPSSFNAPDGSKKKRRHSTSSLAIPAIITPFGVLPQTASYLNMTMVPTKSDPVHDRRRKGSSGSVPTPTQSQIGRLKFLDYLIKPVQRICKYPLLLDQLKVKVPPGEIGGGGDIVEGACAAMRLVCGLVDHASLKQAHSIKSALIVSRIMLSISSSAHVPTSPTSCSSFSGTQEDQQQQPRLGHLTSEFMGSLGACLLAGALDVIHHPSAGRVKYLGAFLYMGGYLVLVKVTKGGKVYEPKYWFSLVGFDVVDAEEDDVAFPYSFHLLGQGHHFQFAAACHLEKEIWMAAILEALMKPPTWINEPVSSLQADEKAQAKSPTEEEQHEWTAPLPTIQSLSDLENNADAVPTPLPSPKGQPKPYKTMSRYDSALSRQDSQINSFVALSRRSSTASVKAFFAPLTFDTSTRITRASSQVRQTTEQGLHDVFSDSCITVRSQAQMREEELFQVRKKSGSGMSRSNSALSITSAMTLAARRRYDSVLVSTRRKGSMDSGMIDITSDFENTVKNPFAAARRAKSFSTKRGHKQPLSIVPSEASAQVAENPENDIPLVMSPEPLPDSPLPLSQCSSTTSSNPGSALPSPLDATMPLPIPSGRTLRQSDILNVRKDDYRPKRTRSMVDNVKYFFHSRSVSPTPSFSGHNSPAIAITPLDMEADSPGGLVQWWRRGSLRRRVQSSPDVPSDESTPTTPGQSSDDNHDALLAPQTLVERHRLSPIPSPDLEHSQSVPLVSPTPRRVAFTDTMPTRRRSLFVGTRREPRPHLNSDPETSITRKTLRNILFFQRSNSFTPMEAHSRS